MTEIKVFFVRSRMNADEFLEFLFGKQAKEDLDRWGLPEDEED